MPDADLRAETPRQRFIRNTGEDIRIMRTCAAEQRRQGNWEAAERIDQIADQWDEALRTAMELEARYG